MSFKSGTTSPPSKSFNGHFNENLIRPERKESVLRVVISTSTSPTDLLVHDLRGLLFTIRSLSFSSLQRVNCHKWGRHLCTHHAERTAVLRISITCGFLNWMQRAFVCHDPSSRPRIQVCGNVMTQNRFTHTNSYLHKFDWLSAWDYVKKCICQVLNNIWLNLKYVWEQNYIDWAFCAKDVIIKFVVWLKHCTGGLNRYLQLSRHTLTVISILWQRGPGRQPRHGAQHVPEFSDCQQVNHLEKMIKHYGWNFRSKLILDPDLLHTITSDINNSSQSDLPLSPNIPLLASLQSPSTRSFPLYAYRYL